LLSLHCFGQKPITINEAELQLQKNNLQLLAQQYSISASQAAVIQAKIWEQPYLSGEFNTINPQDNSVFDIGNTGQKGLAIQQLIYLGGKKKNEISFAKSNVAIAELEFEQLLRNLKYQLNQNFYSVYFDRQKINSLDAQIAIIDTLVINYSVQSQKGNIPLREVVRLQSLVLNLTNERNNLLKDIIEAQQNLSLLTGIQETVLPQVNETELLEKYQNKLISKDTILSMSLESNIEYLSSIKIAESQEQYLKWQKSLAVPDITTGLSYDQRGGAFQNQVNLTFGIPLPLWNKNKGNIKIAEAQLKQSKLNKDYKNLELRTKVETFWQIWQQQINQINTIDKSTTNNLETVKSGMLNNFQKRNITMLEFTDFMESYNQSSIQINELKKSLILSGINLNFITNKEIF
jgi:cobalt-zinc-cadmium efflux system outer membrane protein